MTTGTQKETTRGIKKAENAIEKFEAKAPLSERMNERAREGKQIKVLRRIFGKQPLRNVVSKAQELFKNRKTYSIRYMLLSTQNRSGKKRAFEVIGRNYYPLLNPARREANVKANDFIETVIKRRITKQHDKFLFPGSSNWGVWAYIFYTCEKGPKCRDYCSGC